MHENLQPFPWSQETRIVRDVLWPSHPHRYEYPWRGDIMFLIDTGQALYIFCEWAQMQTSASGHTDRAFQCNFGHQYGSSLFDQFGMSFCCLLKSRNHWLLAAADCNPAERFWRFYGPCKWNIFLDPLIYSFLALYYYRSVHDAPPATCQWHSEKLR